MLKQKAHLEIELQGKKYEFICDQDSPLGCLHDALMQMKGWCVERMIANQKEEESISEKMKIQENETNASDCCSSE